MAKRRIGGRDLCKIDTTRLRALTAAGARRAALRISDADKPAWKKALKYMLYSIRQSKEPIISLKASRERWDSRMGMNPRMQMAYDEIAREHPELFHRASGRHERPTLKPEASDRFRELLDDYSAAELREQHRFRESVLKDIDRNERKIWAAQAKAGCKLRPEEMVARDAVEQGTPERAAEVRASARRPKTPYKGRKPIIR